MSSVVWRGNQLFQRVANDEEQLGYVSLDNNSGTYVLWLKDTCGVLGSNYIRGDEFSSMTEAKSRAASSPSAFIMHIMWQRNRTKTRILEAFTSVEDEVSDKLSDRINKIDAYKTVSNYLDKSPTHKLIEWAEGIKESVSKIALNRVVNQVID